MVLYKYVNDTAFSPGWLISQKNMHLGNNI